MFWFLNLVSSDRGLKTRSCSDHSDQPVQPHGNLSFIFFFLDSVKVCSFGDSEEALAGLGPFCRSVS